MFIRLKYTTGSTQIAWDSLILYLTGKGLETPPEDIAGFDVIEHSPAKKEWFAMSIDGQGRPTAILRHQDPYTGKWDRLKLDFYSNVLTITEDPHYTNTNFGSPGLDTRRQVSKSIPFNTIRQYINIYIDDKTFFISVSDANYNSSVNWDSYMYLNLKPYYLENPYVSNALRMIASSTSGQCCKWHHGARDYLAGEGYEFESVFGNPNHLKTLFNNSTTINGIRIHKPVWDKYLEDNNGLCAGDLTIFRKRGNLEYVEAYLDPTSDVFVTFFESPHGQTGDDAVINGRRYYIIGFHESIHYSGTNPAPDIITTNNASYVFFHIPMED